MRHSDWIERDLKLILTICTCLLVAQYSKQSEVSYLLTSAITANALRPIGWFLKDLKKISLSRPQGLSKSKMKVTQNHWKHISHKSFDVWWKFSFFPIRGTEDQNTSQVKLTRMNFATQCPKLQSWNRILCDTMLVNILFLYLRCIIFQNLDTEQNFS